MANDLLPKRLEIDAAERPELPYAAIRAVVLDTFRSFTINGQLLGIQGSNITFPTSAPASQTGSVSLGPADSTTATDIPSPYTPPQLPTTQVRQTSPEDFRALLLSAGVDARFMGAVSEAGVQKVDAPQMPGTPEVPKGPAPSPGATHLVQSDKSKWHGHHGAVAKVEQAPSPAPDVAPAPAQDQSQPQPPDLPQVPAEGPKTPNYAPPVQNDVEPQVPYHEIKFHLHHRHQHKHEEHPKPPPPAHPPQTINHTGPQQVVGMLNGRLMYLLIACQVDGLV